MISAVLAGLFVIGRMRGAFPSLDRDTARAQILDTRVDKVALGNSQEGSYILYQLEAHVTYRLADGTQDRWIPASDVTSNRTFLDTLLTAKPKTCLVYWPHKHPESPRCRIQ